MGSAGDVKGAVKKRRLIMRIKCGDHDDGSNVADDQLHKKLEARNKTKTKKLTKRQNYKKYIIGTQQYNETLEPSRLQDFPLVFLGKSIGHRGCTSQQHTSR